MRPAVSASVAPNAELTLSRDDREEESDATAEARPIRLAVVGPLPEAWRRWAWAPQVPRPAAAAGTGATKIG